VATVALLIGREPAHRYSLHRGYADAVWAVGATPVVFVPPPAPSGLSEYVSAVLSCDAICLLGGGDVHPTRYGAYVDSAVLMEVDPLRDRAEIACVSAAVCAGRPLLGICRGTQVIGVALGGSLHQDLPAAGFPGHWDTEREHQPVHGLTVTPGSLAEAALGGTALGGAAVVNSIHHQAVASAGPSLTATAWAPDGVIEAIEGPGVLGVQWHPERLFESDSRQLAPFRWLVSATANATSPEAPHATAGTPA
jgi:putative glutamine amidotransferase